MLVMDACRQCYSGLGMPAAVGGRLVLGILAVDSTAVVIDT